MNTIVIYTIVTLSATGIAAALILFFIAQRFKVFEDPRIDEVEKEGAGRNGKAGQGRVTLDQAEVRSATFQVLANGNITLAPILTNSTIQLPVNVLLSRGMGDKIGLVEADTPTNAVYVPMPQFLTVRGTLGKYETDINKTALFVLAAKAGSGLVKGIGGASGEKIGGALEAVGSLLGGGKTATSTNQPSATATNQQPADPVGNLIRGFGGLLGGKKSKETNQPAKPK